MPSEKNSYTNAFNLLKQTVFISPFRDCKRCNTSSERTMENPDFGPAEHEDDLMLLQDDRDHVRGHHMYVTSLFR